MSYQTILKKHSVKRPLIDTAGLRMIRTHLCPKSKERNDALVPQVDAEIQIQVETIPINTTHKVTLAWFVSPLEFYVNLCKSNADLDYTMQMKKIHHFYKNKSPIDKIVPIGSFVVARFTKNNQLYRAKIIDFNEKLNKYKVQLIDVGALAIVELQDVYEMDKIFGELNCQAIKCCFSGVAIRANIFDMKDTILELMDNKTLICKFIQKKADTFCVDIMADGKNVKGTLIRAEYLSILSEGIEIERLVGQTVMARILKFNDLSSFQLAICGCEPIFQASCQRSNKLTLGETIRVRIDSLSLEKTFTITPLIDNFGGKPPICSISFFSNNFKVIVVHWESYNVVYVQSVQAHEFTVRLLDELLAFYDKNGDILQDHSPQTLCAVKSTDGKWYRAEIISQTKDAVNVRYLDCGNCELIPKYLVKRLESNFCDVAALAVKVLLPLKEKYSDKETPLHEISNLTTDIQLDLKVLAYYAQNWIVDLKFMDSNSITSVTAIKTFCSPMTVDELKQQITKTEAVNTKY